jgi:threonine-phosphate decarboxylase
MPCRIPVRKIDAAGRIRAHGGDVAEASRVFGIKEDSLVDFSSNVNSSRLPPDVVRAICGNMRNITRYPDRRCSGLLKALGGYLRIGAGHIAAGNGSADILYRLARALNIDTGLVVSPSFGEYEKALWEAGARVKPIFTKEKYGFMPDAREIIKNAVGPVNAVFLCNPNSPTGALMPGKDVEMLVWHLRRRKVALVLDEAFIEFAKERSLAGFAASSSNLIVLRSMTKFFGLAGLRLGYAVGPAEIIERLKNSGQPWPVNIFAQAAGEAMLRNKDFLASSRRKILKERDFLYGRLRGIKGIKAFPSQANFIMAKIENSLSSVKLQERLAKSGLLIRACSDFTGLGDKYFRIAVRKRVDNLRLIRQLESVFGRE